MTIPKQHASTEYGDIAYAERGTGPCALFVHGVFMNGYLWRHVIERVADLRRCISVDLLAHGATRTREGADLSFAGQAKMLDALCESLNVEQVDLVANDSGARRVIELEGAKLFHPEERPEVTASALRELWTAPKSLSD